MGSFNATCVISNLQIEYGTPVRFFLLTKSKYSQGNDHACYVWGRWQLRGAAIRAKYNDYGSIEDIQESLALRVMFEALNQDAVEKGVGDNQCHDVHVRPGMSQEEWLEALWEGRVFVRDTPFHFTDKDWKPSEPAEGIPSLTRLEELFTDNGLKVVTEYGAEGYILDEVNRGFIRVRYGSHDATTGRLEKILPVLHKAGYAAMVTCGTGHYSNYGEVLVAPRPAPNRHVFSQGLGKNEDPEDAPRAVSQVMVREDVWQILLRTRLRSWGDEVIDIKRVKKDALALLKQIRETQETPKRAIIIGAATDPKNLFANATYGGEGVSGFCLRDAFILGIKLANNEEELRRYAMDLAEIGYVQMIYGTMLHGQWHPTTNSGQDSRWKEHRAFHKKLSKLRGIYEE